MRNHFPICWWMIIVFVAIAGLREIGFYPRPDLIPNPDVSWLLYASERLWNGEQLYVDMFETNPPLIMWLGLLPVALAKVLGVATYPVFATLVSALGLWSLWLVSKTTKSTPILIGLAAIYFLLPTIIYGQREHLFILLIVPYLIASLYHQKPPLISVLLAAIGIAIKPFFVVIWAANEIAQAIEKRKLSSLFAQHNWIIGTVQVIYVITVFLLTPAYFSAIVPAVAETYFAFESTLPQVLKSVGITLGIVVLLLLLVRPQDKEKRVSVWVVAAALLILLQRKTWPNHTYPMMSMAGLLVVLLLANLWSTWQQKKLDIGHAKFAALVLCVGLLASVLFVNVRTTAFAITQPSKVSLALIDAINTHAASKNVYSLGMSLQPGFPAIAHSNAKFVGHFYQLWPLAGIIVREQEGKTLKTKEWFFDHLVSDFETHPPALVWVDEQLNLKDISGHAVKEENRHLLDVLKRDPRFAKIWQDYEKIGEIEEGRDPNASGDLKPARFSLYKHR